MARPGTLAFARIAPTLAGCRSLVAIVAVAGILRFWGLGFGLPYTNARPDEGRIIRTAVDFVLTGDLNPRFFAYPTLMMYAVAATYASGCTLAVAGGVFPGMRACIEADWNRLIRIARAISALAGTSGVLAAYLIARRLHRSAALPAAALLAVAFLHVRDSHFAVTDVPMTSLLLWALLLLLRADESPSARRFALAGLAAGLAVSTKYNAILLVVTAAVSQVRVLLRANDTEPLRYTRLAIFAAAVVAGFLVATPYAVVSYDEVLRQLRFESWHLAHGHLGVRPGLGWQYHARVTLPLAIGWAAFVAGIAGSLWMVLTRPRVASMIFAFPLVYYAIAGRGYTVFARYMIPVVPFLCIGAAAFVAKVHERVQHRVAGKIVAAGLLTACLAPTAVKSVAIDRLLARTDSRVLATSLARHRIPPGSSILMTGGGFQLWHDGRQLPYRAMSWDADHRRLTGELHERPDWIVVEESPLVSYSAIPEELRPILREYELRFTIRALDDRRRVYDQQDAFYLPLGRFEGIVRPGPNLYFYQRRQTG